MKHTKTLRVLWIAIVVSIGAVSSVLSVRVRAQNSGRLRTRRLCGRYESAAIDIGPATWIGAQHQPILVSYGFFRALYTNTLLRTPKHLKKRPAFDPLRRLLHRSQNSPAVRTPKARGICNSAACASITPHRRSSLRSTTSHSLCRRRFCLREVERPRDAQSQGTRVSPDGKWEAIVNNYNVVVRPSGSHELTFLSTDGSEGNYYEIKSIAWSPDSTKLATRQAQITA